MSQYEDAKIGSYSSIVDNKSRSRRESEDESEIGWSVINEEVDTVIPLLLEHLQKLQIEHLQLPDIKENLAVVSIKKTIKWRFSSTQPSTAYFKLFVSEAPVHNLRSWSLSNKWYRLQCCRH